MESIENGSRHKNCEEFDNYMCPCSFSEKDDSKIQYLLDSAMFPTSKNDLVTPQLSREREYLSNKKKPSEELINNSKHLEIKVEGIANVRTTFLNENKYYLQKNYEAKKSLIQQKNMALNNSSLALASYNIKNTNVPGYRLILFHGKEISYVLRILYYLFTTQYKYISTFHKNVTLKAKVNPRVSAQDRVLDTCTLFKIFNLYSCYFVLLNDYSFLEKIYAQLVTIIKNLNQQPICNNIMNTGRCCKKCSIVEEHLGKIQEEYNQVMKRYSISCTEKERMVMKFATSEKRLLESQKAVTQIEKKYENVLKENTLLQKKIQKGNNDIKTLTGEINSKSQEITQLRNKIEHNKDNDNIRKMKLEWTQNRLKIVTDAHKEMQTKLNESLAKNQELINECETLRARANQRIKSAQETEENKKTISDQQFKEQQARLILERHSAEDLESSRAKLQKEFDLLLNKQRLAEKENHLLVAQVQGLQKKCTEYKSELEIVNESVEQERKQVQALKEQLSVMESLKRQLENNEHRIKEMEAELNRLYIEKTELENDAEAYRQREVQILNFTQKLTEKNVLLQCEFTDLQSKLRYLENKQQPLNKSIDKLIAKITNLEHNLSSEKINRIQDSEVLAKYIAQQIFYNQKLVHQIENSKGENIILRQRYNLVMHKMSRELHMRFNNKLKSCD